MNLTIEKKSFHLIERAKELLKGVQRRFGKLPKKKKIMFVAAVVLTLVLVVVITTMLSGKEVSAQVTQTAKVEKGSITNTVVGTGNLELGSSGDINIPSGITVEKVLVESGDKVAKGDTLAKVNSTSVLKAMAETQELIADVDSEISDKKGDTETATITAGVAGRVKKVYAGAGDSVLESMSENQGLMVLSIDGKMAVKIKGAQGLSAGETVSVIRSNSGTVTGTVESASNDNVIITLTDNGPEAGESVTVKKGGSTVGKGKLYIHSKLAVVGTGGTVKSLAVSENQYVSAGTTLYTLKNMPASTEYRQLTAQRQELAELLGGLVTMAQTNTITAPKSGTIETVNVSSKSGSESSTGTDSSSDGSDGSDTSSSAGTAQATGTSVMAVSFTETEVSEEEDQTTWDDTQAQATDTQVSEVKAIGSVQVPVTAPKKGASAQTGVAGTSTYDGAISWSPEVKTFQPDTTYSAVITLTAKKGYEFTSETDVVKGSQNGVVSGIAVQGSGEGNQLTFKLTFAKTEKDTTESQQVSSGAPSKSGDSGSSSKGTASNTVNTQGTASTGSAKTTSATTTEKAEDSSSSTVGEIETVAAFSICSDEEMVLPISVDELDILSIEKGQKAAVTFDAIEDKTYSGKITKVSQSASVNGGVAKYSVDITISADESMMVGMNGSATVTISSKDNILLVPLNALQESGGSSFVYTEKSDDGKLSGKKTVKVGISDGKNAEITSGLSEGDTIYYNKTGSLSESDNPLDSKSSEGFGGGQGAMQPPSGEDRGAGSQGSRPSGGQ